MTEWKQSKIKLNSLSLFRFVPFLVRGCHSGVIRTADLAIITLLTPANDQLGLAKDQHRPARYHVQNINSISMQILCDPAHDSPLVGLESATSLLPTLNLNHNTTLPCPAYVHFFKQMPLKNIIHYKTIQISLMELLPESSVHHHLW